MGCHDSVSIAVGFYLGQAWKLQVHPSDNRPFPGCLPERLLASPNGERAVDVHRGPGVDKRRLNGGYMNDVTPNEDRGGTAANAVTRVTWSMTGEWQGMDTGNHFTSFDQARAVRVRCQHLPDEPESVWIRGFIQIALQPVRCFSAVQDDLSIRKAGIAFRIDESAAMIAV